jgi:hypothetical protein
MFIFFRRYDLVHQYLSEGMGAVPALQRAARDTRRSAL